MIDPYTRSSSASRLSGSAYMYAYATINLPAVVLVLAVTALLVADVEAARARLQERGVGFFGDIFDTGVCHMAFFADPDGDRLMLHCLYAPRETDG